jgi:hypothetical protein
MDLEFGLAIKGIVNAYHINFIDFAEVKSLGDSLNNYLKEDRHG